MKAGLEKLSEKLNELRWGRSFALLFLLFWLTGIALYFPASNAGLIDDGFAGLMKFENQGWAGFSHSFGFTSLYYVHDLIVLLVYYLVGKWPTGWCLVMVTLHCFNATFAFAVFRRFYSLFNIQYGAPIALSGAILFLLSPYQTENVVWAATLHYGIAFSIFLGGFLLVLEMISANQISTRSMIWIMLLFSVSLLTLEISLIFPFAWSCLLFVSILTGKVKLNLLRGFTGFLLPLLLIIAVYFITTKVVKGHWIPHYGTTHLQNNSLQHYSTSVARYMVKLLGYTHFLDYHKRETVYGLCVHWKWALAIQLGFVTIVASMLFWIKKKHTMVAFLTMVCMALLLLFPSLQMYFMYLFTPENDRLSYFFSVVLYQLIPFLLFQLSSSLAPVIILIYLMPGVYFLNKQVNKWHEAGVLHERCIESFVWTEAPRVYILNAPANYQGAYAFRNNERLPYALNFFKGYHHSERLKQVLSSSYSSLQDSTLVTVVNDSTLHVQLITNGGWLMNEFIGATDYASDDFRVKVDEWNPSYTVTFHSKYPEAVYIYSSGRGFHKVEGF